MDMSLAIGLNVVLVVALLVVLTVAMVLPHRLRAEPRGPQAPRAQKARRRKHAEREDQLRQRGGQSDPVYSRS